jgi:predicted nucleic acid-binding protein
VRSPRSAEGFAGDVVLEQRVRQPLLQRRLLLRFPTLASSYDTVIHVEEVLTIRLPRGTRRRLERRAKAQKLSVSQLVRRALEQDELLTSIASARAELVVVRALGSGAVVTSPALLDEIDGTLRARFTIGPAAMAFLEQLRLRVHLVVPAPLAPPVSRAPDDDVVLATAVAANATAIVTGNRDLLVLQRCRGVEIVTPRDFLSRLPT